MLSVPVSTAFHASAVRIRGNFPLSITFSAYFSASSRLPAVQYTRASIACTA